MKRGFFNKSTLAGLSMLLVLALCEIMFRTAGYKPGQHTHDGWFTKVQKLQLKEGFSSDSTGIFRISQTSAIRLAEMVVKGHRRYDENQNGEVFGLAEEALKLKSGSTLGEFETVYRIVRNTDIQERTPLQNLILSLVDSPVNADGFRSIPFRIVENSRPSVLLLGDSFTFGHSANSVYNSFPDILLSRGYTIYNSGISGADVAQYLAIAKKWVPILKPDITIVNFYIGNDTVHHRREPSSAIPLLYNTNAGNLLACPQGICFDSPAKAYEMALRWYCVPDDAGRLGNIMSTTVIGSILWKVLWYNGLVNYDDSDYHSYWQAADNLKRSPPYCRTELELIDSVIIANGSRLIVSIIPEATAHSIRGPQNFTSIFNGLDYVQMNVTQRDYNLNDGHFNDRGHRRYADFLQKLIDEQ